MLFNVVRLSAAHFALATRSLQFVFAFRLTPSLPPMVRLVGVEKNATVVQITPLEMQALLYAMTV